MDEKSYAKAFFLISMAAESIAGRATKEVPEILNRMDEAIQYLSEFTNEELGEFMTEVLVTLTMQRSILSRIADPDQRLDPYSVLSLIVSDMALKKGLEKK